MASRINEFFAKDMDSFLEEFAIDATLVCEGSERAAKVILLYDPNVEDEYVGAEVVAIVKASEVECEKPSIVCEHGTYHTIFKEDDLSGFVRLHLSRDDVRQVAI